MALLGVLIVVWRLISTLRALPAQRSRAEPIAESRPEPSSGREPKPQDLRPKLVRVELVDGRAVEGWRKATGEGNGSVLVLDVIAAYDENGATMPASVADSFIPSSTVREVRELDDSSAAAGGDGRATIEPRTGRERGGENP
jgi:hypothetical protein